MKDLIMFVMELQFGIHQKVDFKTLVLYLVKYCGVPMYAVVDTLNDGTEFNSIGDTISISWQLFDELAGAAIRYHVSSIQH